MTSLALLFTLSAIGISETVYLIKKRLAMQAPQCFIGKGCTQVLESEWSRVFIIHTDVLGLLFYIFTSSITAFLYIGIGPFLPLSMIMKLAVGLGMLLSIFFFYLQWKVIKAWCFWCLMSASTIFLMGLILLISNFF
ncbi:MAG: vitamin K epoxide reductase family protein [Patescibacteria group bacterium]|mgnify:CR=1 FL=1